VRGDVRPTRSVAVDIAAKLPFLVPVGGRVPSDGVRVPPFTRRPNGSDVGLRTGPLGHDLAMHVRVMTRRVCVVVAAALAFGGPAAGDGGTTSRAQAARDPWLRPFSSTSIWNTPLGSDAQYVDADIPEAGHAGLDEAILLRLSAEDPAQPLLLPGSWDHRCSGNEPTGVMVNIPDDLLIEDADGSQTPNHTAAFLLPDGRTLLNTNAVARCEHGGPIFGWQTNIPEIDQTDLYGDGRVGAHGGSLLSGIGGAIRPGELSGDAPIQHALDLLVWSEHLSWDGGGHRWPAERADAYAQERYSGSNPDVQMGSLLAIPPSMTASDLRLDTEVGRKLFEAMQDYGGYVTDDAGWDAVYVAVDRAAVGTFAWGEEEEEDLIAIVAAADVVVNNGPDSIGGGGEPRRPLLPELSPGGAATAPVLGFVAVARQWLGL
jgi:hypothetical protein